MPFSLRRTARIGLLAGAPLLALTAAWWATRGGEAAAAVPAAGGHDHAAMGRAGSDSGTPVTLATNDARRIGVTFAAVEAGPMEREIRAVGQVAVDEARIRTIAPKIDGWVEQLHVDFTGQSITRGAPLLAIYSPMLVTAQEELLLARRLSRDVASGAADAREGAQDLVASARRRLAWWDIPADEIERIEASGEVQRTLTLRAPTGGVVLEKRVNIGQRVMAGEALYRVADLTEVWVEGEVYEQDLRSIRVGQPVTAEVDALPGERYVGRVAYVNPTLTAETRTARVRISLANPGLRLKPGMYATLRLAAPTRAAALSVPRNAVLATGERQLVFVRLADGRLEPRQVRTGMTSDERIEILSGLVAGDTVVASATFLIDAESNLGTAMGGMGDMPGMEITLPPSSGAAASDTKGAKSGAPAPATSRPAPAPAKKAPPAKPAADPHAGHSGHDGDGR